MQLKLIPLSLALLVLSGCASQKTQYYWGEYENFVYLMYAKPGEATPEVQIQRLVAERDLAQAAGKPVPPGVNAHLGMMYAASGNIEQALLSFEEEKRTYPESGKLMDDMIARAKGEEKS